MQLFVNKLTNSDFSYLHPKRGLLGETWLSNIELEGELDEQGMICDFGIVKKTVRNLLDDLIDHRLLVPAQSPQIQIDEQADFIHIIWDLGQGKRLEHRSPKQCITLLPLEEITAEAVADWCRGILREHLPELIAKINLSFSVEAIDSDFYHYSHGLKKHDGKCQRIAHGHRSRIEIYQNGERSKALEQQWAKLFEDIYIGTESDLLPSQTVAGHYHFQYTAAEGKFEILLPESTCYLIKTDSTVENIAQHIADTLKTNQADQQFRVKAFEGLEKGAVVGR